MPRYARQSAPGSVQHIISRFVNRDFLFDAPGARATYLLRAHAAFARTDWSGLAFALMSSHAHWAVQAGEQPSARLVKPLHVGFAGWFNRAQGRLGPVFADRHRTVVCRGETAAVLLAYIHNNPVRAGVVVNPTHTRWTSHRMYVGLDPAPPWLDVARGLEMCGFSTTRAGRRAFHAFVMARADEARCEVLSGRGLRAARRLARAERQRPVEVKSPTAIVQRGERRLRVPVLELSTCQQRQPVTASVSDVVRLVAHATGNASELLQSRSRARSIVAGRRLALLVWSRQLGQPTIHMARALGLASSSAAHLLGTASPGARAQAARLALCLIGPE